ncbi:hypothetical protein EMIT0P2_180099 [Pseudomonas sp. IT-P2]
MVRWLKIKKYSSFFFNCYLVELYYVVKYFKMATIKRVAKECKRGC